MGEPPWHPVLPLLVFHSCLINDTPRSKKNTWCLQTTNIYYTFCRSEIWAQLHRVPLGQGLSEFAGKLLAGIVVSSECQRGDEKGEGIYFHAPWCSYWQVSFFSSLIHSMVPTERMIKEKKRENERKWERLHSSWKPQSFYALISELTFHHFSIFARCQWITKGRELHKGVNTRIQRSLVATLEDTCYTAPGKQQS